MKHFHSQLLAEFIQIKPRPDSFVKVHHACLPFEEALLQDVTNRVANNIIDSAHIQNKVCLFDNKHSILWLGSQWKDLGGAECFAPEQLWKVMKTRCCGINKSQ